MDQDLPAPIKTIKCAEMHINIENGNFSFFCFHCIGAVEIKSFVEICSHIENIHFPKPGDDDPVEISDDESVDANYIEKSEVMRQVNTEFINMQDIIDAEEIQVEYLIDEQLTNTFGKSDMQVDLVGSKNFDLKPKSFKCSLCKIHFIGKNFFDSHVQSHENNPMLWTCEFCPKKYSLRDSYVSHRRKNHRNEYSILYKSAVDKDVEVAAALDVSDSEETTYLCKICESKFTSRSSYLAHLKIHKLNYAEDNDDHLQDDCELCTICKIYFMYKDNYENHLKAHQDQESTIIFHCEQCDKQYTNRNSYLEHRKRAHALQDAILQQMVDIKFKGFNKNKILKRDTTESVVVLKPLLRPFINKDDKNISHQDDDTQSNEKTSYEQHMKAHDENEIWQCEDCDEIYRRRDHYLKHRRVKHTNLEKNGNRQCFTCDMCNKTFFKKSQIIAHLNNVHVIFECKQCNIVFSSKSKLRHHNARHPTTIKYECELCDEKFCKRYLLQIHMSTVHPEAIESKRMHCTICCKRFTKHKLLKEHLSREHANSKFVQCSLCPSKFKSNANLKYHILNKHTDDPNKLKYTCNICQNSYSHSSYLQVHKRIHTGEKPFVCSYCGKQFYGQSSLTIHIKHTHLKLRYKCKYCDKIFTKSYVRNSHELRHTNPQLRYSCETCGKIFANRQVLRNHLYLHQEKRYQCKFCDMKFAQSSGRRGHERSAHKAI